MEIKTEYNTKDFQVGALVGRFHVDELHIGHRDLLDHVINNHKKSYFISRGLKVVSNKTLWIMPHVKVWFNQNIQTYNTTLG
jgi:tRNA A-37 threonylcarbamoyl transferase component Bud32